MKKVSDIIADFIESKKIDKVFLLTGGGIMHLTDSIGKNKNIEYVCNFHEQACAIAAEGYARVTGKPGVCFGTTGPGIANALSGVIGAWHDSIPLMVFGGQVRTTVMADFTKLRQYGPQEGNIIEIARPMTKYSVIIKNPNSILKELEKAYAISIEGRPGPVYLEIPLDIQAAIIDEDELEPAQTLEKRPTDFSILKSQITELIILIKNAKSPILFPGNGIHLSNSFKEWLIFFSFLKIPVVLPYSAIDLLNEDNPLNMGVIGTNGQRRANFAVQNSDLFISLASGISTSKIGFNASGFAPKAKKVIIDIDNGQANSQSVKGDFTIVADIRDFFLIANELLKNEKIILNQKWIDACSFWKTKYPLIIDDYFVDKAHINMYVFTNKISDYIKANEILVSGNGFDAASIYQVFKTKLNQRVLIPGNWGSMGWDLPTTIGACIANNKNRTFLITGDGSIMLNIQELLTISTNKLPIFIFIFNNKGYASIRTTQNNLLDGNIMGSDFNSGIANPNFKYLANAFGLRYAHIENNESIDLELSTILESNLPCIVEINLSYDVKITPKAISFKNKNGVIESKPLEDMYPFLPEEEIKYNMNLLN